MGGAVGIDAGVEEPLDDARRTVERRQIQRADAVAGRRARIRARIEEQIHELKVVALGRPVERGETVALCRVHVCPLFQQRANGLDIFLLHRLNESCVGLLRARRRETGHTQNEGNHSPARLC